MSLPLIGSGKSSVGIVNDMPRAINASVLVATDAEAAALPPCAVCAADELAGWTAPQAPQRCANSGVVNRKHLQSECRDCGKRGTVVRNTGALRPHAPAEPKDLAL